MQKIMTHGRTGNNITYYHFTHNVTFYQETSMQYYEKHLSENWETTMKDTITNSPPLEASD